MLKFIRRCYSSAPQAWADCLITFPHRCMPMGTSGPGHPMHEFQSFLDPLPADQFQSQGHLLTSHSGAPARLVTPSSSWRCQLSDPSRRDSENEMETGPWVAHPHSSKTFVKFFVPFNVPWLTPLFCFWYLVQSLN